MDNNPNTNTEALIVVEDNYVSDKKNRPVRVPERLYQDFKKVIPFNIGYSPMMVNLIIYYLHNREAVNDFINNLTADTGQ
jgi:hypothetical protein